MSIGKLTNPSVIRELLNSLGHRPNKGLGQNYLIDGNIIGIIVNAADISDTDILLEIGPGLGALTQALLATGASLTAIEKDSTMVAHLRKYFSAALPEESGSGQAGSLRYVSQASSLPCSAEGGANPAPVDFQLLEDDVLDVDLNELFSSPGKGTRPTEENGPVAGRVPSPGASRWKIVANLPYSVGSRFIVNALEAEPLPEKMVFMVQKEVADRLTAQPGSKSYGPLAIWSQLNYDVKNIKNVSPKCFMPAPKVWSAVVRFEKRETPLADVADYSNFKRLVKTAFTQRRKQIGSNLRKNLPEFFQGLENAGIDPATRPEQISIQQWVALADSVS